METFLTTWHLSVRVRVRVRVRTFKNENWGLNKIATHRYQTLS
jgi:hypothetical protein